MKKFFNIQKVDKKSIITICGIKITLRQKQILYKIWKLLSVILLKNKIISIDLFQALFEDQSLTYTSKTGNDNSFVPDWIEYDFHRKEGLNSHIQITSSEIDTLISHSILNKIKENNLKQKIRNGKKVNVCFIVTYISRLSFISIYQSMIKNSLFNPYIVLYNAHENYFKSEKSIEWQEHLSSFDKLKSKGFVVYNGYDENRNYIPIENFKPDIIFSSDINMDYLNNHLSNIFLNINYLVCYLYYFFNTINTYNYHYNNRAISTGWKLFMETREDYNEIIKYSKYCGTNAVLFGYPKIDAYAKDINDCKLPDKINNGNPVVIYAPHHTINKEDEFVNIGTFHLYYDYFLKLVKKYPNINFVFKPHPELRHRMNFLKIMSLNEFDNYTKEWDSLKNGLYLNDGDYIDLFRKSDLLIQDSVSFIGEWLPSDKPCMYLVNPNRNKNTYMKSFSTIGVKILEKYYLCKNIEEIEKYFNMIMIDKSDPLKEERVKLKDEIFINIGCVGQKITDYLNEILIDA